MKWSERSSHTFWALKLFLSPSHEFCDPVNPACHNHLKCLFDDHNVLKSVCFSLDHPQISLKGHKDDGFIITRAKLSCFKRIKVCISPPFIKISRSKVQENINKGSMNHKAHKYGKGLNAQTIFCLVFYSCLF